GRGRPRRSGGGHGGRPGGDGRHAAAGVPAGRGDPPAAAGRAAGHPHRRGAAGAGTAGARRRGVPGGGGPVRMPISVRGLIHTYDPDTPFARQVLFGVDLEVGDGEIVGIAGPSRSGKSTLAQYLGGLLRPRQPGMVVIDGIDTGAPDADIAAVRTRVGMVFQFPEDQLFERTVELDVGYAPRLMKMNPADVEARVREALETVGMPFEEFRGRPVHALSGGQKRRVAVAGVLAKGCRTLVLDEPTAGLDPLGS